MSRSYVYATRRWASSPTAEDVLLLAVFAALLATRSFGALGSALSVAIPIAIGLSFCTLHRPTRVEVDDDGIAFSAYGRQHRFVWREIERVRVRRFAVRDRVFVRITPAPRLAGRYWLRDSFEGYRSLVEILEHRGRSYDSVKRV